VKFTLRGLGCEESRAPHPVFFTSLCSSIRQSDEGLDRKGNRSSHWRSQKFWLGGQWRGNYFRTGGGQDRVRQSREREI